MLKKWIMNINLLWILLKIGIRQLVGGWGVGGVGGGGGGGVGVGGWGVWGGVFGSELFLERTVWQALYAYYRKITGAS